MPSQEDKYRFMPEGQEFIFNFPPSPYRSLYSKDTHLQELENRLKHIEDRLNAIEEYRKPTYEEEKQTIEMLQAKVREEFAKWNTPGV